MKKKLSVFGVLAIVLAFGLVSCGNGTNSSPTAPIFTLTNISPDQQTKGQTWFVFGLFPTGTSSADVLADAKHHKANTLPSNVIAFSGGASGSLPWSGIPGGGSPISISSVLTATSGGDWIGSGLYDGWVLVCTGTTWNGYKLAIDVQGNMTKDASLFVQGITNQT